MKTLLQTILALCFLFIASASFAQSKKETFKVAGECGTCQRKIESAAKKAGASFASWNKDSKLLTIRYNSTSTNTAKVEQAIAAAGYDTPDVKATDKAYNKLDACCQYERSAKTGACCASAKCKEAACMNDGKCTPGSACCKESGCDKKACCKKD